MTIIYWICVLSTVIALPCASSVQDMAAQDDSWDEYEALDRHMRGLNALLAVEVLVGLAWWLV